MTVANLYLTQDVVGIPGGGGIVTHHEYEALKSLDGLSSRIDRRGILAEGTPMELDLQYLSFVQPLPPPRLTHIYAGCFTETVRYLKSRGSKITYTAAAHDVRESRREFEDLGLPFNFPHLVDPELWKQYLGGYLEADWVICPSRLSASVMASYGCRRIEVIPHGCDLPQVIPPLPKKFTVGYLGQSGPDKGLRYLFSAWKELGYRDSVLLLAGANFELGLVLWRSFGGGPVEFLGTVPRVSDFFSKISILVQPSVTEGFGIGVLEAMAHGRGVIVSDGAGAVDCVSEPNLIVPKRNVAALARAIDAFRQGNRLGEAAKAGPETASQFTWDRIRQKYVDFWKTRVLC